MNRLGQLSEEDFQALPQEEQKKHMDEIHREMTAQRKSLNLLEAIMLETEGDLKNRDAQLLKSETDVQKERAELHRLRVEEMAANEANFLREQQLDNQEKVLEVQKAAIKEREDRILKYGAVVMEGLSELAGLGEEGYRQVLAKYATIAGKFLTANAGRQEGGF